MSADFSTIKKSALRSLQSAMLSNSICGAAGYRPGPDGGGAGAYLAPHVLPAGGPPPPLCGIRYACLPDVLYDGLAQRHNQPRRQALLHRGKHGLLALCGRLTAEYATEQKQRLQLCNRCFSVFALRTAAFRTPFRSQGT